MDRAAAGMLYTAALTESMLEKSQIEVLLPHQGAMFLLERVVRFDRNEIDCIATSHRDPGNPLRHLECLPAHVAIEYAAQTAGVHGGLLNRQLHPDAPAQMGYLAVVSNLHWQVDRLDDLPGQLEIHARRTAVTPGAALTMWRYGIRANPSCTAIWSLLWKPAAGM
jgi:predicted hotdog family 3-hydroxylacyl-ACP dehydratase